MTKVFYASDGEGPVVLPLDTLVENFDISNKYSTFHGDTVDTYALRRSVEEYGYATGTHTLGNYVVVSMDAINTAKEEPHAEN